MADQIEVPDIEKLFEIDGYLRTHEREIRRRYGEFTKILKSIDDAEGKVHIMCQSILILHLFQD